MKISDEANELLSKMLAREVQDQIRDGRGEEPMPEPWRELHLITIGFGESL